MAMSFVDAFTPGRRVKWNGTGDAYGIVQYVERDPLRIAVDWVDDGEFTHETVWSLIPLCAAGKCLFGASEWT
jgi:hypothetical protein